MNSRSLAWVVLVGCASFVLAACSVEGSEEADDEDLAAVTAAEEAANVSLPEALNPGGNQLDGVYCGGARNYCLTRCSRTGSRLHVVGTAATVGYGNCIDAGERYCRSHGLGYRTDVCWGYVTNDAVPGEEGASQ